MKVDIDKLSKRLKRKSDKKGVRRLRDMKNHYSDKEKVKKILKIRNPIIYEVFTRDLAAVKGSLITLAVINPGRIGKEYYMTKGHIHKKPIDEIYILVRGKGKLILQDKRGKTRVAELKKGRKIKVSGKLAHRLVNTSKRKLEVLSIYSKAAGHDYSFKFKKRIMKK